MTRLLPPNYWMLKAIQLAEQGRFKTSPNPMVGACVVRSNRLISEGYHEVYGGPHAEVAALTKAGAKAQGASLYVTLEPCSTWGKTPPCTEAIIRSGVREVIIGTLDPNPRHAGKGVRELKRHGIRVRYGVCARQAADQNKPFFKWIKTGLPYVTLKMAQSLDGKIATPSGKSRWITSESSRQVVQSLRAESDAVMVGFGTLRTDNPSLTVKPGKLPTRLGKPWRIILDPRCEASPAMKVFQGNQVTLRVISEKFKKKAIKLPRRPNANNVLFVPEQKGKLDLSYLLRQLGSLGISKILVEGGGELAWSLLEQKQVDKLVWMVAPKLMGGRDAKTSVEGRGVAHPSQALPCHITKVYQCGPDWIFEAEL